MLVVVDPQDVSLGVDDLGLQDVVTRQAVGPAQEPETAAEAVAGVADGRAFPAGVGQPVLLVGDTIHVPPPAAGLRHHGRCRPVERDALHVTGVDYQPCVGEREAAGMMAASAY